MNQERVSASTNSSTSPGGHRSHYQALLAERRLPESLSRVSRFGQGLLDFTICFALFVAILTVFGQGLSWLDRAERSRQGAAAQPGGSSIAGASASMLPAPPAQPAGHAELPSQ